MDSPPLTDRWIEIVLREFFLSDELEQEMIVFMAESDTEDVTWVDVIVELRDELVQVITVAGSDSFWEKAATDAVDRKLGTFMAVLWALVGGSID